MTTMIFSSTTDWDAPPLTERYLAQALGRELGEGHQVLFVDKPHPLGRSGWQRHATSVPEQVAEGVHRLRLLSVPRGERGRGRHLMRAFAAAQVRRALAALGAAETVLVTFAYHRDLAGRVGESTRVLYLKDAVAASGPLIGLPSERLVQAADAAAAHADLIVSASPLLAAEAGERFAKPVLHLPPGCVPAPTVAPHPRVAALPAGIRVGVVGTLNDRVDWSLLQALLDRVADAQLVLAGPRSRLTDPAAAGVLTHPRTHAVGTWPHAQLPELLAGLDVALVPYSLCDFNLRSSPLKVMDYLAAGLPVVGTPIPALAEHPHVEVVTDADQLAAAVVRAAVSPAHLVTQRRAWAAGQGWDDRARRFALAVDAASTTSTRPRPVGGRAA